MINLLGIGDPHIRRDTMPQSTLMVDRIVSIAEEQHKKQPLDGIIVFGDTLDKFGDVRIEPLVLAVDGLLGRLSDIAHVYLIIGNHDMIHSDEFLTKRHPFTATRRWTNLTLCDTVVVSKIKNMKFTFCPYVPDGRFMEALATNSEWESSDAIFCHQNFVGAMYGKTKTTKGDRWSLKHQPVFSGHIHLKIDMDDIGVYYIGSPTQHDFGDINRDDHSLSLYTFSRGMIDGMGNPKLVRMIPTEKGSDESKTTTADIMVLSDTFKNETQSLLSNESHCEDIFPIPKGDIPKPNDEYQSNSLVVYETQIRTNLPKRVHIKLQCSEVMRYTPPHNTILKLTIVGTGPDIKAIKRLDIIKVWKSNGVMIVYEYKHDEVLDHIRSAHQNITPNTKKTAARYRDDLYEQCLADPDMLNIYGEFYPNVKIETNGQWTFKIE